jgi:hypothetical protein
MDALPEGARALLRLAPVLTDVSADGSPESCRAVTTGAAREIVRALEGDPRIRRQRPDAPRYDLGDSDTWIDILPILPDGEILCWCG